MLSTIKDWDLCVVLQGYCVLQGLLMKMDHTLAVAPLFVHPMTSLLATPVHSIWKYGSFDKPAWQRKWQNTANLNALNLCHFLVT